MQELVALARSVSPAAAGLLVASIWQGLLLTAGVAIVLRLDRGVKPAVRTSIWTAVLLLVLSLPVLALVVPHRAVPAGVQVHVTGGWSMGLLMLWALFGAVRGVRLAGNALRLGRLVGRAVPVAVDEEVAALLEGPRRAVLCVSAEVNRPSVSGLFRARVLLPAGLLETLSAAELKHVVLHEMEHLRRRDDWLNLLQQVSLVLLPLNPALFWLDRRLCRERELACDDGVLEATEARHAYAACLVKLAEDSVRRKGLALAMSALGTRARESELMGRVRRILAGPERVGGRPQRQLVVGTLAIAVAGAAILPARGPQWIRFDEAPQTIAQEADAAQETGAPRMEHAGVERLTTPVADRGQRDVPRPALTRAIMTETGPTARPHLAVVTGRRMSRPGSVLAGLPADRFRRRPGSAALTEAVGARRIAATERVSQPPATLAEHLVVTEFDVSQPGLDVTWAAVPWRGGWLIVQL